MKRAKSIFLWCGELVEQWRGWLPYWGFCSKKVRTSIKKHRQLGNEVIKPSVQMVAKIAKALGVLME